ncbi:reticulon-like protein B13 [Juglans microcarpa x Juglans regia]|uniref:reticulon-like protein B13 n=1 Tax=Juglans microcarpa x Juglans regia TaxID=2249226 RepID=UPI001B7F4D6C|nr:reticulon-like protein B13 [Juglans microcarpa x Juglans regia]
MSTASQSSSLPTSDTLKDIFLWRRKRLSVAVLLVATAIWVLMEVYQFNFITVISWTAMFVVVALFLWANILRLLGKEPPNMSGLEIPEESAIETANCVRAWIEEGIRWVFRVSAERDWFAFAGTVSGLWLLSYVGKLFDLLTLLYIGIIMGMTVPALYIKFEEQIKRIWERVKMQCRRLYDMVDEKVVKNMKNRVVKMKEVEKEKKAE